MSDSYRQDAAQNFDSSRTIVSRAADRLSKLKVDRVILATLAVGGLWLVTDRPEAVKGIGFLGENLLQLLPFLAVSVLLAAYLKASGADRLIARAFSGSMVQAIFMAAAFGAMSPFCSCGVIPLIAALLASGVPLAPVMAFWLASPIMDPEMFVLTAAVIGTEFATVKTVAAFGMGLLGGFTVLALDRGGALKDPLAGAVSTCGAGAVTSGEEPQWRFWTEEKRRTAFAGESRNASFFLGKWMSLAFLLEAVMLAYVPMQQVGAWLGEAGTLAIPAAAVIGVPAYMNGYAAIPLTNGLMEMGLTPAAALTFMVAGGVTSIPAAIAVKALVKLPVFALYIVIAMTGSISAGLLYGLVA